MIVVISILGTGIIILLVVWAILFNEEPTTEPPEQEWVQRHKIKAQHYSETHLPGTKVVAENKNGEWKKGKIIGNPDWILFACYSTIQFDDGEIYKQEESKITIIEDVCKHVRS